MSTTINDLLFVVTCIILGTFLSIMLSTAGKLVIDYLRCSP